MARRTRNNLGSHEHTEESYFVSLNDLLIGMLFVFIILLMIFALNYQSAEARLNQRVEALEDELGGREDQRARLLRRLKDELAQANVPVGIDEKNGVLHLPETVLFASGSADLGDRGRAALSSLAALLARELPCYGQRRGRAGHNCPDDSEPILEAVYVEGHTDTIPIANARYSDNWSLSSDRSIQTYRSMVQAASSLEGIRNAAGNATLFGVSAYAAQRPIADNASLAGRARNRRIDVRFLIAPPTKGDIKAASSVGSFLGAVE
jgi:chemotaxis protein MotB